MSDINDGGPAFPVSTQSMSDQNRGPYGHQDSASTWQFPGLTIRDYFAAKAMQGWIANSPEVGGEHLNDSEKHASMIAAGAYRYADAMLKARSE